MQRKALLLINESSGAAARRGATEIVELAAAALAAAGLDFDVATGSAAELIAVARRARTLRDIVVCAGGDGTVACVAGALAGSPCALLPLPCGTMNLFCRDLGLPADLGDALRSGLNGEPAFVDVARCGRRVFLNNVVFGVFAEIAEAREDLRAAATIGEAGSAIVAGAGAFLRSESTTYAVRINRRTLELTTNALTISNNAITSAEGISPLRARLDEGFLSVYLAEGESAADFAGMLAAFVAGDPERAQTVNHQRARHCTVGADRPMRFTIDGDPVEERGPVTFSIRRQALKVLRPRSIEATSTKKASEETQVAGAAGMPE